jgi:hypothetical protein
METKYNYQIPSGLALVFITLANTSSSRSKAFAISWHYLFYYAVSSMFNQVTVSYLDMVWFLVISLMDCSFKFSSVSKSMTLIKTSSIFFLLLYVLALVWWSSISSFVFF